ncbi:translation initiation factor IF-2 [uncultured Acetobacteroides sp.]|uniref:translation initiation factor IF-2 n=1 Tax=uncultured Acetobacteroides sp. TaxID=1760811 RepID=UPI0029F4FBEA|nr:translation initiation factor IF-2 [uncultured Acetobacteroides sp.]
MTQDKSTRLLKAAKELNVGVQTIVDFLHKKGIEVDSNPNSKITTEAYLLLEKEFGKEFKLKAEASKVDLKGIREKKATVSIDDVLKGSTPDDEDESEDDSERSIILKDNTNTERHKHHEPEVEKIETPKIKGPNIIGKIDLEPKRVARPAANESPIEEEVKPQPAAEVKAEKTEPSPIEKTQEVKIEKAAEIEPATPVVAVEDKVVAENKPSAPVENKIVEEVKPVQEKPATPDDTEGKQPNRPKPTPAPEKEPEIAEEPKKGVEETKKDLVKEVVVKEEVVETTTETSEELFRADVEKLSGPTVVGKIDLSAFAPKKKPVATSANTPNAGDKNKKKRKRIKPDQKVNVEGESKAQDGVRQPQFPPRAKPLEKGPKQTDASRPQKGPRQGQPGAQQGQGGGNRLQVNRNPAGPQKGGSKFAAKKPIHKEVSDEDVQKQIKDTLARLTAKGAKSKSSKYRRDKRDDVRQRMMAEQELAEAERSIIKVTEFVTVNELANMMDVPVTDVIGACMNLGLMVSINQRLDAEALVLVAEEFGYKVEFVAAEIQESIQEEEDKPEDLLPRSPIVTVMGHVDHGKTSLLDYIRKANVIAGEAGGITQHIGAYSVKIDDERRITFLDTPGHEAFTAMRARGAKVTDIAIIIIAADDSVMPQTKEAINHAVAAGVPMVFAINKVDKPGANPERIREQLAAMNYLVEDWGGKYQVQEISAKKGEGIQELLDKVLLEAEMLELKANPNKNAVGSVIESTLDKGRGYVTTMLVHAGTLKVGDVVLSGPYYGRVKAMFNERGKKITKAGPSVPVLMLGLNGAPTAGETFNVLEEREAKDIANKREQLQRMQGLRATKHITLDEIGRRIAVGNFKELNIIVKGDVDGSIEALTDSLIKLSNEEVQVNVIHKAVGQISESDVLLAAASNAIVVGFQVRPSTNARRIAENEGIEIRHYSIIYDAINEVKDAIEGMLSPEIKEETTCSVEVMEVFKITKVGTIAGCIVREGTVVRNSKIRIIRDGIVVHSGELDSLKRFKDDVKEVKSGFECGLSIKNYSDIQTGDFIEGYELIEVKKTLD